jgi:hypothetical protein
LMGAPSHATATAGLSDAPSSSTARESSTRLEQPEQTATGVEAEPKKARRFGIFTVVLLLAATGAFGG